MSSLILGVTRFFFCNLLLSIQSPVVNREVVYGDVDVVLKFLCVDNFEPMGYFELTDLTKDTSFK